MYTLFENFIISSLQPKIEMPGASIIDISQQLNLFTAKDGGGKLNDFFVKKEIAWWESHSHAKNLPSSEILNTWRALKSSEFDYSLYFIYQSS